MINQLVMFFVPLAYFLLLTAAIVLLSKRSFGYGLVLGFLSSALALFLSQCIFGTFTVGFVLMVLLALSFVAVFWFKKDLRKEFRKNYFSLGFWGFLTIYIFATILNLKRGFSVWDEFSHWGMMLKEMIRLDKFYYVDESNLMVHKDYPPIQQLFELFWMKLCGGFNEIAAERSARVLSFSFILPILESLPLKKKKASFVKKLLCVFAVVMIPVICIALFDQHGVYNTIYNDYTMSMGVTFLLALALLGKKYDWFFVIEFLIGGIFLVLLKQMGLPLYYMALAVLGAIWIASKKFFGDKKNYIKAAVLVVVPILFWLLWGRFTADAAKQFDMNSIGLGDFINALLGRGEVWQRTTILDFISAVFTRDISLSIIPISYLQAVLIFIGVSVFFAIRAKKEKAKKVICTLVVVVLGAIGYALAMMILYVTAFGEIEGPALASFERYMGSFAIILFVLGCFYIVHMLVESGKSERLLYFMIALALVLRADAFGRFLPTLNSYEGEYKYAAAELVNSGINTDSKVFISSQDKVGVQYYMQYFANPISFNSRDYSWPTLESDEERSDYLEQNIYPQLKDYDYLFVYDSEAEYLNDYCAKMGICEDLAEGVRIYQINTSDAEIRFEKFEQ